MQPTMEIDYAQFFEDHKPPEPKWKTGEETLEERKARYVRGCGKPKQHRDLTDGLPIIRFHFCHYWRECPTCMQRRIDEQREMYLELKQHMELMYILLSDEEWRSLSRKIKKEQYRRNPVDYGHYVVYPTDLGLDFDRARPFTEEIINDDDQMRALLSTPEGKSLSGTLSVEYQPLNKSVAIPTELETPELIEPGEKNEVSSHLEIDRQEQPERQDSHHQEREANKPFYRDGNESEPEVVDNPFVALGLVEIDKPFRVDVRVKDILVDCPIDELVEIHADIIEETRHLNPSGTNLQKAVDYRDDMFLEIVRQKGYYHQVLRTRKSTISSDKINWNDTNQLSRQEIIAKIKSKIDLSPH